MDHAARASRYALDRFQNDGTAKVPNRRWPKQKLCRQVVLAEKGKEKIKVNMQAAGKSKYEMYGP